MTDYVLGFAISESEGNVLLIRKKRPEWQARLLNGIGGKIEHGESPVQAMVREFKEECGVDSTVNDWKKVVRFGGINPKTNQEFDVDVFYSTSIDFNSAVSMTDEEVEFVYLTDIQTGHLLTVSNLPWLINMCFDKDIEHYKFELSYNS